MTEQKPAEKKEIKPAEPAAEEARKQTIKKGDFIEIDYIGQLKPDETIFDTTDAGVAKKEGFFNENHEYGPAIICVGENYIVKGIDEELEGKQTKTEYVLELPPEKAFGKKDAKLIQLISTAKFLKQNIQPQPGLQVNIDGNIGTIKSVSGGRTLVDFNHPLSSLEVRYKIRVNKIVKDDREKLKAYLAIQMNTPRKSLGVEIKEGKATVKTPQKLNLPKELTDAISKKVNELIPGIKEVEFTS